MNTTIKILWLRASGTVSQNQQRAPNLEVAVFFSFAKQSKMALLGNFSIPMNGEPWKRVVGNAHMFTQNPDVSPGKMIPVAEKVEVPAPKKEVTPRQRIWSTIFAKEVDIEEVKTILGNMTIEQIKEIGGGGHPLLHECAEQNGYLGADAILQVAFEDPRLIVLFNDIHYVDKYGGNVMFRMTRNRGGDPSPIQQKIMNHFGWRKSTRPTNYW
jgi:hypothetical protein